MEAIDIEDQIRREVEEVRKMYGECWSYNFFNNFHLNLPGGYETSCDGEALTSYEWAKDQLCSERKKSKTPRDFFAECALAVSEAGLTQQTIQDLRNDINTRGADVADQAILLSVYIILRKMGYNHYPDLTC